LQKKIEIERHLKFFRGHKNDIISKSLFKFLPYFEQI
jgi:hypothetical protein